MPSCKTFTTLTFRLVAASILFAASCGFAADGKNPFIGRWALTLPNGAPGWLSVEAANGYYDGGLLWAAGSVVPVDSISIDDQTLYVTRIREVPRRDTDGKASRTHRFADTIAAKLDGDKMSLTIYRPRANGTGIDREEFSGQRMAPLPPPPNLSKVKFGERIELLNGRDLSGWKLTNPKQANGWVVENGILINRAVQPEGKPRLSFGNLRTDREFEDFNLTVETRLSPRSNSGIYLRGIYEVQVANSHGRPLDSHNMGAIYSRITPTESAEKPAGEWQTLDITLCDRHATVILNGKKIIDNQPLPGCTGGALWADDMRPGPIYLQGDHTSVEYRNMVLRPIMK
jgi:hypothetical protein